MAQKKFQILGGEGLAFFFFLFRWRILLERWAGAQQTDKKAQRHGQSAESRRLEGPHRPGKEDWFEIRRYRPPALQKLAPGSTGRQAAGSYRR